MKVIPALLICIASSYAFAATPEQVQAKVDEAQKTVSLFECAVLASSEVEATKLVIKGVESGRAFLKWAEAEKDAQKLLNGKLQVVWYTAGGPTIDFKLGYLFGDVQQLVLKDLDLNSPQYSVRKGRLWQEKNCALLK